MRRSSSPCAAACSVRCSPLPAGASAFTLGVSDQQAVDLHEPALRAAEVQGRALHHALRRDGRARPTRPRSRRGSAPRPRRNQSILVSFEHSHRAGASGRRRRSPRTRGSSRSSAGYPDVKDISPWNEVNRCQAPDGASRASRQICKRPPAQARRSVLQGRAQGLQGPKYTIVALDILDEQNVGKTIDVPRKFKRYASRSPSPGASTTTGTPTASRRRARSACSRPVRGKVWLTETGGIVKLGTSVPGQHEPRGQGARVHVHPARRPTGGSSGCTSTSSTPPANARARLRRRA